MYILRKPCSMYCAFYGALILSIAVNFERAGVRGREKLLSRCGNHRAKGWDEEDYEEPVKEDILISLCMNQVSLSGGMCVL